MGNLTHTVSGDTASFRSAARVPIESLKCHFLPVQEGTGDPSPENVRPITGWNSITAYKAKKNIGHLVSYSAGTLDSPHGNAYTNGYYGQTLSTTDTSQPLTITSTQWPDENNKPSYKNGYFCIQCDNLQFGQIYSISFKVTNITNNPLECAISDIRIGNPKGNRYTPTLINDNILLFTCMFQQNPNRPQEADIAIYNCGMSCTFSEFMITPSNMNDGIWEPYCGDIIPITFPVLGKNKLNPAYRDDTYSNNIIYYRENRITLPAGTYTLSTSTSNVSLYVYQGPNGQQTILFVKYNASSLTFTLNEDTNDLWFNFYTGNGIDHTATCQLELNSDVTTYEPYDSNNTVYGGYVDIAKGEVVATHILLENMWSEWTLHGTQTNTLRKYITPPYELYSSSYYNYVSKISNIARYSYSWTELDETHFYVSSSTRIYMWLPIGTDESTKIQVLGTLLNPIHYPLSKTELKTFLDQNNIWSNTNDITEVSYQIHDSNMIKESKKNMIAENNKHYQRVIWNNLANGYCNANDWVDRSSDDSTTVFDNGVATTTYHTGDILIPSFRTARINDWPQVYTSHKYYAAAEFYPVDTDLSLGFECAGGHQYSKAMKANIWTHYAIIVNGKRNGTGTMYAPFCSSAGNEHSAKIKNVLYIDLTLMFGEGKEPTLPEEFEALCVYNGINLTTPQSRNITGLTMVWKVPYKTVIWNQWGRPLLDTYYKSQNSNYTTLSFNLYEITRTMIADSTAVYQTAIVGRGTNTYLPCNASHKYYQRSELYSSNNHHYEAIFGNGDWCYSIEAVPNTWTILEGISSPSITNNGSTPYLAYDTNNAVIGETCTVRNFMYIDLTQMFGEGREPSLSEFKRLCILNGFDLATYHDYNTGTIIKWIT